jgi:hypothetical protein
MALKSTVDSLDDIPEALKGEYKEVDGKFVLQTDETERVNEFRTNNVALQNSINELTTKVNAFGTKTPEQIAALETELSDLKTKADGDDKTKTGLAGEVAQLTEAVNALTVKNAEAEAALAAQSRGAAIRKAATDAGANPVMLDDLVLKAERDGLTLSEDGATLVQKSGDVIVKSETNPAQDKAPGEYFAAVFKVQPAYQANASGGGGQPPGSQQGGKPQIDGTDPLALGQHAEAIAKGEVEVADPG